MIKMETKTATTLVLMLVGALLWLFTTLGTINVTLTRTNARLDSMEEFYRNYKSEVDKVKVVSGTNKTDLAVLRTECDMYHDN